MDNKITKHPIYDASNLALNVWQARNNRGLTIESLAEMVGVSSRFITQIESGQRLGSVSTLIKIANELGVTLGSLFE